MQRGSGAGRQTAKWPVTYDGSRAGVSLPAYTAHYKPSFPQTVTTVDGLVSQITDATGNGNTATQGTAANRPLLSGASMLENKLLQSELRNNAAWTKTGLTSVTDAASTSPIGNAASRLLIDTSTGVHRCQQLVIFNPTQALEIEFKAEQVGTQIYFEAQSQYGIFVDDAGTVVVSFGTGSNKVTSLGDGWFRVEMILATTSTSSLAYRIGMGRGSASSYTGNGTDSILVAAPVCRDVRTSSTYIQTTTSPIIAGLQNNRGMVFDGSNDSLGTSLAVNPTGGMWGVVVVKPNIITADQGFLTAFSGTANDRLEFYANSSGIVRARIKNGTAYIGRQTPALTANETCVLSFTYDGGTAASGVKIYKNGIQIDNADSVSGVYTVPTAGNNLEIGRFGNGSAYLNGTIYEAIFAQGSTITDGNRQLIEQSLITQYIPNYIYFDPASNVTAISNAVASWTDTTNTYVASQSTAASRPAVSTLNGQVAFDYDGSADGLTTNYAVNVANGLTCIIVANADTLALGNWMAADVAGVTKRLQFLPDATGVIYARIFSDTAAYIGRSAPAGSVVVGETAVFSFVYDGGATSASVAIYKNGAKIDTLDSQAGAYSKPSANGTVLTIGGYTGVYFNGKLADGIIAPRAMPASERQNWEQRLMEKFNIA